VAIVALVVGVLTPLPATAAATQPQTHVVPPIVSPPVKASVSKEPSGEFDVPKVGAKAAKLAGPVKNVPAPVFDAGSATVTSRDEFSTTYTDKNGVRRTEVSPTAVNVKDGDNWVAASSDLSDEHIKIFNIHLRIFK
jgi:hypothetical protein